MPTTVWGFLTRHSIMGVCWKRENERAIPTGIVITSQGEEMQCKVLILAILLDLSTSKNTECTVTEYGPVSTCA